MKLPRILALGLALISNPANVGPAAVVGVAAVVASGCASVGGLTPETCEQVEAALVRGERVKLALEGNVSVLDIQLEVAKGLLDLCAGNGTCDEVKRRIAQLQQALTTFGLALDAAQVVIDGLRTLKDSLCLPSAVAGADDRGRLAAYMTEIQRLEKIASKR